MKISEDYSVTFADYDGKTLKDVQTVHEGDDATPPETPSRDGYVFTGWAPSYLNV